MADSTIDSDLIYLRGGRFGTCYDKTMPIGGFTGSAHHNVAAADRDYPIGMVKRVYCDGTVGVKGFAEFVYLAYEGSSAPTAAAKQVCVPDSSTVWYQFTNDPDSCVMATGSMLAVVAISAMTDGYYGWFWCGGVCPEVYVSALGGNYATTNAVIAGNIIASDLSADAIGFGPKSSYSHFSVGFSVASDAA
jgi:hypothetical protein